MKHSLPHSPKLHTKRQRQQSILHFLDVLASGNSYRARKRANPTATRQLGFDFLQYLLCPRFPFAVCALTGKIRSDVLRCLYFVPCRTRLHVGELGHASYDWVIRDRRFISFRNPEGGPLMEVLDEGSLESFRRRRPDPYKRNAAISWHFECDPIPYALETDWPVGAAGLAPLHQVRARLGLPLSCGAKEWQNIVR